MQEGNYILNCTTALTIIYHGLSKYMKIISKVQINIVRHELYLILLLY